MHNKLIPYMTIVIYLISTKIYDPTVEIYFLDKTTTKH